MSVRAKWKSNIAPSDSDTEGALIGKLLKTLGVSKGDKVLVTGTGANTSGPYYRIHAMGGANVVTNTFTAADWNGGVQVTTDVTILAGQSLYSATGFTQVTLTSGVAVLYKM